MLKSIPPEEKKTYVTLYRTNGYSYTLTLLAIIAEFVYVTTILDSMPVNFWMGLTVIMNIFVLFLIFTCAVKINVYSLQWAVITLAVGFEHGVFHARRWCVLPCEAVLDCAGISPTLCTRDDSACFQPDRLRFLNHCRSNQHN